MPENQNTSQVVNSELSRHVISEYDLLKILNIEQVTLSGLRYNSDFPVIYLNNRNRVYLIGDVVDWLKSHKGYIQRKTAQHGEA